MSESKPIDFRFFAPLLAGILILILGTRGYQWAYPIGTLLIFSALIFSEFKSLLRIKENADFEAETERSLKIYYLTEILQSVLSIIGFLLVIGWVAYGYFYQKDVQTVLNEIFQPGWTAVIFLFLGVLFSLVAVNHFLAMWLTKSYKILQILYGFKILFIGVAGVLFILLGLLYLILSI
jgi:hypothetical protein